MYRVVISCAIHLRIKEDAWIQGGCRKESQSRYGEQGGRSYVRNKPNQLLTVLKTGSD